MRKKWNDLTFAEQFFAVVILLNLWIPFIGLVLLWAGVWP